MTKAILFDVDGVLLDSFETNLEYLSRLMKKFGHRGPTREELVSMFHLKLQDAVKALVPEETSENEIQGIVNAGRNDEDVRAILTRATLVRGVEEMLESLVENYTLGIVTSRTKKGVHNIPKLANIEKYFKVIITQEETTHHKPDPEPLLLAMKKLDVSPNECVYVGDTETDLQASRAAGVKFVLYNYSNRSFPGADAETRLLTELPKIISLL